MKTPATAIAHETPRAAAARPTCGARLCSTTAMLTGLAGAPKTVR
jgi:hypothetical protein